LDIAPIDAAELMTHVGDVFSMRAEEAGITLDVQAAGPRTLRADFDRVEQVLSNLIDNALRHTPRGGRIELRVEDGETGYVECVVRDDGKGIAAEDLPHIFDRFYRRALGEPETPGAGLGLAISRGIVRAHGGEIHASARSGGGTEFRFTLPAEPSAAPAREPAPPDALPRTEDGLQPS
ncbi:MAG: ATP-binding protein, partial [Dehalococcoidia bacterium]